MESPGRKRAREPWEDQFPELQNDDGHEEGDPIPCARDRVEPQFKTLSFYEQALWQQWHNKRERERREKKERDDEEVNSRAFQLKNAKTYAQEVLDNAIEYANDRGAKHAISRDTLFAQHVRVQMLSLKADWATTYDYTNELNNIGNCMDNIGNAIETLATAVEGIEFPGGD